MMMQQSASDEGTAYEPQACSYDDLFPALPESVRSIQSGTQWTSKMRVGSSVVTQVFRVPFEERKFDHSDKFGEGESMSTCSQIMKDTGAHIEISSSKDQSLTFLVTGKQNEVLEARRKILIHFQTQANKQVRIPVEHHRWILGKGGARLRELEKQTATKIHMPTISEGSDIITITGTRESVEKAEHEIRVWSEEQSKKALVRVSVPKIYHPFIFGAYNEVLNNLTSQTKAHINVPPPSVAKDEIVITGEKEGVMAAKSRIEQIHRDMEKRCGTVSVEVPKSQHKYVIGPRGSTIAEILRETNVSIEMPPSDSSVGTITLRGPHDKLGMALNKVYERANSVKMTVVEAPAWIHKYIIGRKGAGIRKVTQDLPKVHVEFTDDKIKIEGPPEEVEKAQEELDTLVKDFVNRYTFIELPIDPKYYKHIIGKNGSNVNRLKEETGVIINIVENDGSNTIRIEGTYDGVEKAKQELETMVEKMENEKTKDIIIENRFYASIIGTKGNNIREIRDKFNRVTITIPTQRETPGVVTLRGPKEDVDKCHKHLIKLVKSLDESSYSEDVPIFKQFHKFVIGKAGANIRRIRDETKTKIDLPAEGDDSDVIKITGKKENVIEAREKILKIQNELTNIVNEEIIIPPKFYNSLIGAGGKLIHSIIEECGVAIKFPTPESQSDKVSIRGTKEDVEKAKQQLIELTTERQLSSFTLEVRAKPQHHKFLIGKNGANIKKLRDSTGARIVFPTEKDEDKEAITIIGRQEAVERAKAELEANIKEIDNIIEDEMIVEPRHHRHFVAKRGEVLHRISNECGGVIISFPRPGVQSDRVVLKGTRDYISTAKMRIEETVSELDAMVTIECIIPQRHHRTVMGAKGCKVQAITSEHDVTIKFPDKDPNVNNYEEPQINGTEENEIVRSCDKIRITGREANCLAAKQALLDLVPITVEVDVPFDYHRSIIGQKGRDVRELMDTYDVHIVLSPADQRLDVIKITGTPVKVEKAKAAVQERCKALEAEKLDRLARSFELKLEVDPDYHPKIIGRKGAVISKIRADHGVQINFPRKEDSNSNIIIITGYEKQAYAAKEDILKIVNELNDMIKEEVHIDARVHSRLIGARGRNIRKIMDDYKVDIKFPRNDDVDPDIVTIIGNEDSVYEAKDHLLNLEEEYLQDVTEAKIYESYRRSSFSRVDESSASQRTDSANGFVVKGGPWEQQQAPNTASVKEFPSFRSCGNDSSSTYTAPASGVWGQR